MERHEPAAFRSSPIAGRELRVIFDGGRLTSGAGVLVLTDIERRFGIASGWRVASWTRGRRNWCATRGRHVPLPGAADRGWRPLPDRVTMRRHLEQSSGASPGAVVKQTTLSSMPSVISM
jgi:hypothetical protein